jgi:hypothetical protein
LSVTYNVFKFKQLREEGNWFSYMENRKKPSFIAQRGFIVKVTIATLKSHFTDSFFNMSASTFYYRKTNQKTTKNREIKIF